MDNSPTRSSLRKTLRNTLKTDTDIDAFLIDYFPDVKVKCSDGMNTEGKLNLLLEHNETEVIYNKLNEYISERVGKAPIALVTNGNNHISEHASSKAELLFQQINYVFASFNDLLSYDLAISAAGEMLPGLANKQTNVKYENSVKKLEKLTSSFEQNFDLCRKTHLESGFWLSEQDRKFIESYLNKFSPLLAIINKNLAFISNLTDFAQAGILLLLDINKHMQYYRSSVPAIDSMRSEIEQHLRTYSTK